ncbi:hypothetical protein SAMN05192548_1003145 [Paraburkholderia terricola]|uniref:Uncharacterized protein n=2 Tax=Burkholderiaceae TaxID=119060 RepID=A0A1M6KAK2_9BURK|nr:hypothetical protein SAMN05192547_1003102 [Paraburkholderia sediminicola]SHJ55985.1 hypothetical protein SAMN05192548_1003145 [Paraburkholderia terricola]
MNIRRVQVTLPLYIGNRMTNIYAFTQKKNRQVSATTGEIVKNAALSEVVACMRGAIQQFGRESLYAIE